MSGHEYLLTEIGGKSRITLSHKLGICYDVRNCVLSSISPILQGK